MDPYGAVRAWPRRYAWVMLAWVLLVALGHWRRAAALVAWVDGRVFRR